MRDSVDSKLNREVAKLRDELASRESAAGRSRNNHIGEHITSGSELDDLLMETLRRAELRFISRDEVVFEEIGKDRGVVLGLA